MGTILPEDVGVWNIGRSPFVITCSREIRSKTMSEPNNNEVIKTEDNDRR